MSRHGARAGSRSAARDRLQLLATLAELRAELARRPLALHMARAAHLRQEIAALATTRAELRRSVDGLASGETPMASAAYLTARGEDLRTAQAAGYQSLARAEAEMAELKETAARARARADVLARLGRRSGRA